MALTKTIQVNNVILMRAATPGDLGAGGDLDTAQLTGTVTWTDSDTGQSVTRQKVVTIPLSSTQITQVHNFCGQLISQVAPAD